MLPFSAHIAAAAAARAYPRAGCRSRSCGATR